MVFRRVYDIDWKDAGLLHLPQCKYPILVSHMNCLIYAVDFHRLLSLLLFALDRTILFRSYEQMHPDAILTTALPRIALVSPRQSPIDAALTTFYRILAPSPSKDGLPLIRPGSNGFPPVLWAKK